MIILGNGPIGIFLNHLGTSVHIDFYVIPIVAYLPMW